MISQKNYSYLAEKSLVIRQWKVITFVV